MTGEGIVSEKKGPSLYKWQVGGQPQWHSSGDHGEGLPVPWKYCLYSLTCRMSQSRSSRGSSSISTVLWTVV